MIIQTVQAREILDSRGNPTIEVDIVLQNGIRARAAVPSGASTGSHEAAELRDNDLQRYFGKGVRKAVEHVNEIIAPELEGLNVQAQIGIDRLLCELDGTQDKSRLGANAILGVSLACARAAAAALNVPLYRYIGGINAKTLPVPMMNVVNGGMHSDAPIDFQEFMICPYGAENFRDALRMGSEVFHALKAILKSRKLATSVGDEGGFASHFTSIEDVLCTICEAIEKAGYRPGKQCEKGHISLAIDCAASEFCDNGLYRFKKEGKGRAFDSKQLCDYLASLCEKFPIDSIEDGMAENDFSGWKMLTQRLGKSVQLVGDDIFVTHLEYLRRGIAEGCANAILIKPNQIGTLTETLDCIDYAHRNKYKTIISHRSGETEDTFIADLAVACNAGQIKTGSLCRSERISKYNQLLRIEESLEQSCAYAGECVCCICGVSCTCN